MSNMGALYVLEGLDGSGKATQTGLLAERFAAMGREVKKVSFPVYESDSSMLVRMYLAGKFGSKPEDVNAYAASSFYAVDRYASYKADWESFYCAGGTVLADRYTTSNAIHQCAKMQREEWDAYLTWLFDYEYRLLGIPAPNQVIYLHVDYATCEGLMDQRYGGDGSKKDIHERDVSYMSRCQEAAEYCAEKLGWATVECVANGVMRSIADIHEEIVSRLGW